MCAHLVAGMAPRKKGQYLNRTDLEEANRSSEFREAANIKLSVVTECGGFCCLLFLTPKLLTKFEAGKEKKKGPSMESELQQQTVDIKKTGRTKWQMACSSVSSSQS